MMIKIFPLWFLAAAATAVLAGCASTGDPREGGIFWSESKAQDRQQALRREDQSTWAQAEQEQAEGAQLRRQRASVRASIAEEHRRIASMESELSDLSHGAANQEMANDAAELERKRSQLESAGGDNPDQLEAKVRDLENEIARLKERNKLLKETR